MKIIQLTFVILSSLLISLNSTAQKKDHNKSNKHMNKSSFENLVRRFDNPEREKWQKPDLVIEKLGDISNKVIGDIGSGTGYFAFRLAKKAKKVVAIDVDKRFLDFIKEKKKKTNIKNIKPRLVAYDDPKLANGELDAIITVNTYHQVDNRSKYFKKCKNLLATDGILMVIDFHKYQKVNFEPPNDHMVSVKQVKEELEKAGF